MKQIPKEILTAVNAILAQYDVVFDPTHEEQTYLTYKEAAEYTRLSKQTLQRAVRIGKLPKPFSPMGGKGAIALFRKSDLDAFVQNY